MVLQRGGHFLNHHLNGAVAGNAEDVFIGAGDFRANCCRITKSHRAEPTGINPATRFVEGEILRNPHLVLTDIGSNHDIAAGEFIERFDNLLRFDALVAFCIVQRFNCAPLGDLFPPGSGLCFIGFFLAQLSQHFIQDCAYRADNRNMDDDIFCNRRRVNIDMDNFRMRTEFL